jgi:hypothetical protein
MAIWPASIANPQAEIRRGGRIEADSYAKPSGWPVQNGPVFASTERASKQLIADAGLNGLGEAEVGFAASRQAGDGPGYGVTALAKSVSPGPFKAE